MHLHRHVDIHKKMQIYSEIAEGRKRDVQTDSERDREMCMESEFIVRRIVDYPHGRYTASPVGVAVGRPVGCIVGSPVGIVVGRDVGCPVGRGRGLPVGAVVGWVVGWLVDCPAGCPDGVVVGWLIGCPVGVVVG